MSPARRSARQTPCNQPQAHVTRSTRPIIAGFGYGVYRRHYPGTDAAHRVQVDSGFTSSPDDQMRFAGRQWSEPSWLVSTDS